MTAQVCLSQQEVSIGELLEEAKIDPDNLLKEVNAAVEKEAGTESPTLAVKEPEADTASTPRPRLFRPKQQRPSLQKSLKSLQDQQRSESQLVSGKPDQEDKEAAPPKKRFRPATAPLASTSAAPAQASSEAETSTSEPKPSRQRSFGGRSKFCCSSYYE